MKATLFMDGRPPEFEDYETQSPSFPDFFGYDFWVNSQLSTARFFGGCKLNGVKYVCDMETGDLVKFSYLKTYLKNDKPRRLKESQYAKAKARGEIE